MHFDFRPLDPPTHPIPPPSIAIPTAAPSNLIPIVDEVVTHDDDDDEDSQLGQLRTRLLQILDKKTATKKDLESSTASRDGCETVPSRI